VPADDPGQTEEIHFVVIIKGLDSEMIGASQQVFLEAPIADVIAESTGVPPESVHDMDGNSGSVSMGPGTEEVRQQWWPRASPECSDDNEPGDPYTIVSGMVPLPRDEAHEFSEKVDSEALRENLVALLERKFPKGALAVTGHMQVCAANDAHEELPTSSTMTTRTATTRTSATTLRPVAPPALAGTVQVGALGSSLPGPTFTTTETTTMDTFAFSTGHCHWCLDGNGPRGPLVDTQNCHTFLQEGRSFVSTIYQDQCLDLFNNMFGSWGLWGCSGADQQLFSRLDEDTWCATKGETTMCLSRCRQGADGKLNATTTAAPFSILRDGFITFKNSVTMDEWWKGHVAPSLTMWVGMLLVLVLGGCLISTCCRARKEDEEQRGKHQYHNDSYFDFVEDGHDDQHHHHHHHGADIDMGDSD
jgi:hypothetical protein